MVSFEVVLLQKQIFTVSMSTEQFISQVKVISSTTAMDSAPDGFTNIELTNLNEGTTGRYIYLCYNVTEDPTNAITGLEVVASLLSSVPIPVGYTQDTQDLNEGAWGKYIYLCYREGNGSVVPPVNGITVVSGTNRHIYPEKTYTRINQDCNEGAGGSYVFIAYKRAANVPASESE